MQTYRVSVVACYQADCDLTGIVERLAGTAAESSGAITFVGDDGVWPKRPTLIATYEDVEGRDEEQARQLAIAIFKLESSRWALPDPEALLAASPSDPFVISRAVRGGQDGLERLAGG